MTPPPRRLFAILSVCALVHLTVHALHLPAWEGPDEPFHLSRVLGVFGGGPSDRLDGAISSSVAGSPCGPNLRAQFGCPPFRHDGWNLLRPPPPTRAPVAAPDYEAHQPPLHYAAVAALDGAFRAALGAEDSPEARLLRARLVSVLFVAAGLLALGTLEGPAPPRLAAALLLPGAAEALARCANDAGVFLVAASTMLASRRDARLATVVLCALGPLVKLTALPVAAVAALSMAERSRKWGATAAVATALFVPIQLLRGWSFGGTVELNAAAASPLRFAEIPAGLLRSTAVFVKTSIWLGGWSFFRPPVWVLLAILGSALAAAVLLKFRTKGAFAAPHAAGLLLFAVLSAAFFVAHRRFWGTWGGVGGWYLWGLAPWLAFAAADLLEPRWKGRATVSVAASLCTIALIEAAWWVSAVRVYG